MEKILQWFTNMGRQNEVGLPVIHFYSTNNAHLFYMICKNAKQRRLLIAHPKKNKILAVLYYISLDKSNFYKTKHDARVLIETQKYSNCLLRLPLFYELSSNDLEYVIKTSIQRS